MMKRDVEILRNHSERGSAGVKFILFLVLLILVGNAGWNYIPIAYTGTELKQKMQTAVVQGMAVRGGQTPLASVKLKMSRLVKSSGRTRCNNKGNRSQQGHQCQGKFYKKN